jgi:prefoldin subunit 5
MLTTSSALCETVTEFDNDGYLSLAKDGEIAATVAARVTGQYKPLEDFYTLSVDKKEVAKFFAPKKKLKTVSWGWNSPEAYFKGEYGVSGYADSEWITTAHIAMFAWEEEGRMVPPYIESFKPKLEQCITVKDKTSGEYYLDQVARLIQVELYRVAWLKAKMLAIDEERAAFDEEKKKLNEEIVAAEKKIAENEKKIEDLEKEKAPYSAQLVQAKQELARLIAEGAPAEEIAAQQAKVTELEAQVQYYVRQIEALHVETYNLEDMIKANQERLAEIDEKEKNDDVLYATYSAELKLREEDIALASAVLATYGPLIKNLKKSGSGGGETTVVVKEEKDDDWARTFGIACIPALAIAMPVGVGIGIAYTEWRKDDTGSGFEDGDGDDEASASNELDKQLEEPVKAPKRNVSVIRDMGTLNQEIRTSDP